MLERNIFLCVTRLELDSTEPTTTTWLLLPTPTVPDKRKRFQERKKKKCKRKKIARGKLLKDKLEYSGSTLNWHETFLKSI